MKCFWCGEIYNETDIQMLDQTTDGFFCDMCDGFTFFDPVKQKEHRMLLLLESSGDTVEASPSAPSGAVRLRKRLSPLRYPGGKSFVVDALCAQTMPQFRNTFVEVFAGGASLGLSLLDAGCVKQLILNDADPFVYSFWNICLREPDFLISRIADAKPSAADFWNAKKLLSDYRSGGSVACEELAWAFFLLNRTCFSGIIFANPMGGRGASQEKLLSRWNPKSLIKRIRRISELSPQISLYNRDFEPFLIDNAYWLSECTLFVDPPYVAKGKALYTSSFDEVDHRRLADVLQELHCGFGGPDIIITYDDCPLIRELYQIADIRVFPRRYQIANKKAAGAALLR